MASISSGQAAPRRGATLAPRDVSSGAPDPTRAGKIEVSSRAIARVAGQAVTQCYGVVGLAARHARPGRPVTLPPGQASRGVEVRFVDDHIQIDLYVVLEHGLRITEIAHSIMDSVTFAVERALGVRVVRVQVNVQALRVSAQP